jgi:hypothetical protein
MIVQPTQHASNENVLTLVLKMTLVLPVQIVES